MRKMIMVTLLILTSIGCASVDKTLTGYNTMPDENERKTLVKSFSNLSASQRNQFINGKPFIGMTQSQLEALMGGEPKRKQSKLTSAGNQEIQLYGVRVGNWKTGTVTKYYRATMTEGKLSEFQELDNDVGSFDKL